MIPVFLALCLMVSAAGAMAVVLGRVDLGVSLVIGGALVGTIYIAVFDR